MKTEIPVEHKFLEASDMTFQEVFDFAYKGLIPVLRGLAQELGEDRFLAALKKVAFECARKAGEDTARQLPCNDFAAHTALAGEPSHFGEHILSVQITEDTPRTFALKVTECLWAKTFRALEAADIGYLLICHRDYADCQGFNPRISMSRSKTLMQGDECCDHRFVWEQ